MRSLIGASGSRPDRRGNFAHPVLFCREISGENLNFARPPAKAGVKLVSPDNPEELVRLLHEEAKAI